MKRFKKRYFIYLGGLAYLLFNSSCLSMRKSISETHSFFTEKNIPFQDTIQKIQGRDIHYIQTGKEDAPTLVFIHGSPGSWDAYASYLADKELTKKYRIIAPDRPGFGYSNFRKSLGLKAQASILNELLVLLSNGTPYTLIGHSYGGPLIAQMAVDQPALYDNLVVLAGALDPKAEKPENWRYPFRAFPLKYLVPGALRPANDELIFLKTDLYDLQKDLHKLNQNVLIIHGTKDKLVPYQSVPYMEKEFTNANTLKVVTLEGENHFFVWSKKEFVQESIINWLSNDDE